MHRSLKPHAQAKKVTKVSPPALPGDPVPTSATASQSIYHHSHQHQHIPLYRLGGSISGATGKAQLEDGIIMSSMVSSPSLEEGGFNLPREPTVALRIKDELNDYASAMSTSGSSQTSAGAAATAAVKPAQSVTANASALLGTCSANIVPCPPPVFCATLREPLTHKAAVYYHQQLALQEDQGIDLTQSPGRDSPGSSSGSAGSGSRHSTASLDSGRASSYLTGASGAGSIRSSGGGGALSSPRCSSVSSCSIGSMDRQRNEELIIDWLMEMKYEEYAQLFIAAGYDLPTIARMTPEDLTAIGIKNPHHRERIKQRIDKLQVLDNLPHFVPGSIEEWLQLLRLEEYIQPLLDQNYKTVRDVTQVTWEDLEDIGIVKLGHQKKILLAIKRVKDIISGKWNPGGNAYHQQIYTKPWHHLPPTPTYLPTTRVSWDDSKIYANTTSTTDACTRECCSGNDVVLIKVRQPRGKSLESLEDIHDNSTRSHLTFSHYTTTDYGHFAHPSQMQQQQQAMLQQQQQHHLQQASLMQSGAGGSGGAGGQTQRLLGNPATMNWRRSYDDGDITPTNDAAANRDLMYEEGGGTLPRQQRGILQRAVLNTMPPLEHHHYMNAAAAAEYVCHTSGLVAGTNAGGVNNSAATAAGVGVAAGTVLDNSSLTNPYITGSPLTSKKIAPEPPRRHCSIRNSRTLSQDGTQISQHSAANMFYGPGGTPLHSHNVYLQQQQQQQVTNQPIYANYATIQQTTAEIHCEKFHDNKSNSSIDSIDTIPFANENTGTIKQRLLNRQELSGAITPGTQSTHLHSSSSSSSSSSTNTIANIAHSFHSLKTSSSLHDASLIRSESIGSTTSGGSAGLVHLRSPTLQYPPVAADSAPSLPGLGMSDETNNDTNIEPSAIATPAVANAGISGSSAISAAGNGPTPKVSVNVLNDIGNMLANLTDELDAMLEEEKRVGLNIDSE